MADYCTICLLGAMDRLWFHQIIFSPETTTLFLSNNLKIPEQQTDTLVSTYPPSDTSLEDISAADKTSFTPSDEESDQDYDEEEYYTKNEITRSNPLLRSDQTSAKTISRSFYSSSMTRLQKTMSCKTLLELELEEVKGFMDLGFKFNRVDLSPITMSIVPGLQRLGRFKHNKAQVEAQSDEDEVYEENDESEAMRPYLSEAWLIKRPDSPLLNLKIPRAYGTTDMKKHLKYWARTVASVIQQES